MKHTACLVMKFLGMHFTQPAALAGPSAGMGLPSTPCQVLALQHSVFYVAIAPNLSKNHAEAAQIVSLDAKPQLAQLLLQPYNYLMKGAVVGPRHEIYFPLSRSRMAGWLRGFSCFLASATC
jgi:hypothetical protein